MEKQSCFDLKIKLNNLIQNLIIFECKTAKKLLNSPHSADVTPTEINTSCSTLKPFHKYFDINLTLISSAEVQFINTHQIYLCVEGFSSQIPLQTKNILTDD